MRPLVSLRVGLASLALLAVSGCDLAVMGLVGPAVLPGTGRPLEGMVLDARTRLPIGGATVHSGLGSTVTDASGHFALYGRLSSREVSVSRAGYTALTIGGISPGHEPKQYLLSPMFADAQSLPKGFLEVRGQVVDEAGRALSEGLVLFAGQIEPLSNGAYAVRYEAESPGKLLSTVIAAGHVNGRYQPNAPFSFASFGYELWTFPLGATYPQSQQTKRLMVSTKPTMRAVQVRYSNLSTIFSSVQTDIALDFGVAGFVPVARALGSNQAVSVPALPGLKYYMRGEAKDATGRQVSTVNIVTNDPGKAAFQLLAPPRVLKPRSGATAVESRPAFEWAPSTVPGVVYEVVLMEGAVGPDGNVTYESKPKWTARTTDNYVTYPGFAANDINAGALRADRRYLWHLRAVDALGAEELPTRRDATGTFRVRKREAETLGNTFSL